MRGEENAVTDILGTKLGYGWWFKVTVLSLLRDRNFKFDPNTIEVFDATVELYRDLASGKLQIIGGNYEEYV